MRTVMKWLVWIAGGCAALIFLATGYVYVVSEREVRRRFEAPLTAYQAPRDEASIESGRRLAIVHGCTVCHGSQLQGRVMFDEPGVARIRTPNVVRALREYTDSELERLLRRGVKRDGSGAWVMPASTHLTDDDLGVLIAYARSLPQVQGETTEILLRPLGRIGVAMGTFQSSAVAALSEPPTPRLDHNDPLSLGRYLVASACTECHGKQLQGSEVAKAPSLLVAAAYSKDEDFVRLMRTGVGIGERDLGKMSAMSRERFAHFTDEEVRGIQRYLQEFVARGGMSMP